MSGESRMKDNKSSLAHRAQQKYNAGKYVEAIDALQKLSEEIAPERDLKVQHNLALASFVSNKFSPKEFEQNLRNLLSSLAEEADKRKNSDKDDGGFSIERESSFIRYNLAACLFQQKQYAAASAVLEALVRNIEPIDEDVAMHVCFLYLDIILHSSRGCVTSERERTSTLKRASTILAFLEKPHSFNGLLTYTTTTTTNNNNNNSDASASGGANNSTGNDPSATSSSSQSFSSEADKRKDNFDVVEFRFRLHLYKSKICLLQSNLKSAKKEVKSALEIFQKEIKSRNEKMDETTGSATASGLSHEKTSTSISHPSLAVQNSTGLFLKANLEYLRKNYKKCIKLLASCSQEAIDESIFLNNMGCIHYQMGLRKAAQSYFSRALEATSRPNKATKDPVVISALAQYEIMYNNGVQLLLRNKYALAFRCFHASSRLFFNRPKLWLRMGECCTAAFAEQQHVNAFKGKKSGLIQDIIGAGSHRRVLLPTTLPSSASQNIELDKNGTSLATGGTAGATLSSTSSQSARNLPDGIPQMNLPFAAKCFKNCVLLANQLLESFAAKDSSSSTNSSTVMPESEVDSGLSLANLDLLRQKALVNLSYAYLCMFEPHLALEAAKELLSLSTCSKSNRFLAKSYSAEALCMVSRANEATETLHQEKDLMVLADEYAREAHVQNSLARASVHVNNATSLILQGKVAEAEESVTRAVRENPTCRESLELLVYVLLKKGDTKKALRVLREAQVTS